MLKNGIDGLLIPGLQPAYKHKTSHILTASHAAHLIPNALGYTGGVLPITKVADSETVYDDDYKDIWTQYIKENLKGSQNLPVGV